MPSEAPRTARAAFRHAAAVLLAAAALLAPPATARAQAPAGEPYHLSADRLEGSTTTDENVLKATKVTVTHGATRVVGDSALIYQNREFVVFRGNVVVHDGATVMRGEEASYDRKARRADLRGNVRIEDQGTVITGREATFYRAENRSVITGDPMLRDSVRTLRAQRIEYDRTREVVVAIGDVDAEDRAESTRIRAGRVRYDRRADYAWAQDSPRLTLLEAGGVTTEILADTLRFDNARSRVYAIGDVHIDRDSLRATCGEAAFYRSEDRALLLDAPRAVSPEGTARGDTIEVRFTGGKVSSLQMRPNAVVEYQDRDLPGGERTVATGDTITLFLEDDAAREAFIVGRAKSEYWPSAADSAQGGRNTALGDTIRVEFEESRPRRAIVLGRSEGIYHMAAEGDTAAAAQRERIRYRGTRIEYDVVERQVDVLGAADVVYKEMHLTADRVRFDARTEKMRAEGGPVLQDGNDRIVGETMTYDLGIRRGTIYEGRTTYDRGFFAGEEVRRVTENVFNVRDGSYTTCDLEEPHYHFGSKKMRLVLREKVVAKPVVFYIKKIPVLALPFYIFPIKSGRHSGFQLPQVEFGSSSAGGKFIRNLGYYWAINDYLDATAWADYYQDAQWIGHGQVRYNKRYHYSGQVSGSYLRSIGSGPIQNSWDLQGTHYQTIAPGITLRGLANMTNSSTYYRSTDYGRSVVSRVQRNLRSSLAMDRSWSNASLNVGLVRNQDLDPDPLGIRIEQQLPSASLRLTARPLGREARGREPAVRPWLAKTLVSFGTSVVSQRNIFVNRFPPDSIEARRDSVVDARTAARHDLSLTDNRNLGFLRVTTGMRYTEVFYSRDQAGNKNQRAGVWGSTFGLNLQAFGTFRRAIGPLRALRHVVTPAVTFAYQPSYPKLSYIREDGRSVARFDGVRGIGALGASEQRALQFSLRNDIHLKWGDPEQPKVINNFIQMNTSGSYNFLAERIGEKPLSNLFTTLRVTPAPRNDFSFSFVHNPYDGRLLSFTAATGVTFSGKSGAGGSADGGTALGYPNASAPDPAAGAFLGGAVNALQPSAAGAGLPWSASLSLAYSGARTKAASGYNPWGSTARTNGSLALNLSRNWRVEYAAQADLLAQDRDQFGNRVGSRHVQLVSQNFSVTRDLHCWQMQFTRSISGDVKEFYFKISVKNLPEVYYEQGSRGLRGFGGVDNLY